jgi:peptidyl-prolyl cis-trans isomerase SurA
MSIKRSALALFLILAAGFAASAANMPNPATATPEPATSSLADKGTPLDRIVAVVNDGVILQSELDRQTQLIKQQLAQHNTTLPSDDVLRHQVLDHMITTQLELQAAKNKGIQVSDDTVNQTLAQIAQQNGFTLDEMPAKLAAQGLSYDEFRDQIRTQLIERQIRQHAVDDHVFVSPAEIDQYLAQQAQQGHGDTQYHLYQILLTLPQQPTPEQVQKVKAKADEIYKKLQGGADFSSTAVAVSNGQEALHGGDLGWLRGSELPASLADAILSMQPGTISQPIRDANGYHIVKLADKRSEHHVVVTQTHARHILIRTNLLVSDEDAKKHLEKIRGEIEHGASFADLAKKYSNDPGSATEGGDLGWLNPGQVVPKFQQVMDKLKVNEISEPFQTQFGWHIVQVLGRRQQDQTEDAKRRQAYSAIHTRKLREQTEQWLRTLRDQAYISIRLNGDAGSDADE